MDCEILVVLNDEVPFDSALGDRLRTLAGAVLVDQGVKAPAELNLILISVAEMTELNGEHMGHEGPTDVLSFPIDDDPDSIPDGEVRLVGDVVLCPEVAAANAPTHAGSFEDECALLLVHGCLHLLGFDHRDLAEEAAMWTRERELIERHWGQFSLDPWRPVERLDQRGSFNSGEPS